MIGKNVCFNVVSVKSLGNPSLGVVSKGLTQPTVAILNKQASTPKPTIRVNPAIGEL